MMHRASVLRTNIIENKRDRRHREDTEREKHSSTVEHFKDSELSGTLDDRI